MDRTELLRHALIGLHHQKTLIDQKVAEIGDELTGGELPTQVAPKSPTKKLPAAKPAPALVEKKKRKMSAASRKSISAAQKKRWAEYHKQKAAK